MGSHQNLDSATPTEKQLVQIKTEVKQAAIDHLNTKDTKTSLSHFPDYVITVRNDRPSPSFESLAKDVRAYYEILKEVHLAVWDETLIRMINSDTAVFTARFPYRFTKRTQHKEQICGAYGQLYI